MAAKHRTPRWAIAAIVSFLLTACIPATAESEMPISAPAPGTPLISIHNPLVLPVGDTPLSSGGPFQGWPGVEVERHGLKIFHPHGWLFASSQEQLRALRPQLDEAEMADALLTERESYVDSLTPAGQEHRLSRRRCAPVRPPQHRAGPARQLDRDAARRRRLRRRRRRPHDAAPDARGAGARRPAARDLSQYLGRLPDETRMFCPTAVPAGRP